MQKNWSNCQKCELANNRKLPIEPTMEKTGIGIMLLLSEDRYSKEATSFFKKVLHNASEDKIASFDFTTVNVVGCPRGSWSFTRKEENTPFKSMCGLSQKQVSSCRDRVLHLIDKTDPDIIIAVGLPAAKSIGVTSGHTKFFNSETPRELEIRGHLVKIPRVVMLIPTLLWLSCNISMDEDGPTAKAVRTLRTAINYYNLKKDLIGDKDV